MTDADIEILDLSHKDDGRGTNTLVVSRWIAERFPVQNIQVSTVLPGHTRGNHAHRVQREILLVLHADRWSLHWDTGPGTAASRRVFHGAGTVAIQVPPHGSHAVRNDGHAVLYIVALADRPYDPANPDVVPRPVTTWPVTT
jgi:dTDP-4-dehydrorhamnose 3,5-epimerase-like enzyme